MPTGYTAGILEGEITTFEQYAKKCLRAFGAALHLRDEPLSVEYSPDKPSEYYLNEVERKKQELEKFLSLTDDEIIQQEKENIREEKENCWNSIKKKQNDLKLLNAILKECNEFNPPTSDHIEFKKFMISQINETISWDCSTDYYQRALKDLDKRSENINPTQIRDEKISNLKDQIKNYQQYYDEEVKRVEGRNLWVQQLFDSL